MVVEVVGQVVVVVEVVVTHVPAPSTTLPRALSKAFSIAVEAAEPDSTAIITVESSLM